MKDRVLRDFTKEDTAKIAGSFREWRIGCYDDVPGFCKSSDLLEIAIHGHVLSPGRYVGAEDVVELVGNYKNGGKEWTPRGEATEVEAYDFIDADSGKAIPYGIYDPSHNLGWVSVGTDHDTAQFAVHRIGRWWEEMGEWLYPEAKEILIMCDGGGSNATRSRLWKNHLDTKRSWPQALARLAKIYATS